MRESVFQRLCIEHVKGFKGKLLCVNIHGSGYSNKGFPDLLIFGEGRAVAVELKADSGYQLQPDQMVWRNRFKAVGIPHYVIKTFDDFKLMLETEFKNAITKDG